MRRDDFLLESWPLKFVKLKLFFHKMKILPNVCRIEDCFFGLEIQECPLWEVLQNEYKIFMRGDDDFSGILASEHCQIDIGFS